MSTCQGSEFNSSSNEIDFGVLSKIKQNDNEAVSQTKNMMQMQRAKPPSQRPPPVQNRMAPNLQPQITPERRIDPNIQKRFYSKIDFSALDIIFEKFKFFLKKPLSGNEKKQLSIDFFGYPLKYLSRLKFKRVLSDFMLRQQKDQEMLGKKTRRKPSPIMCKKDFQENIFPTEPFEKKAPENNPGLIKIPKFDEERNTSNQSISLCFGNESYHQKCLKMIKAKLLDTGCTYKTEKDKNFKSVLFYIQNITYKISVNKEKERVVSIRKTIGDQEILYEDENEISEEMNRIISLIEKKKVEGNKI